MAGEIYVDVVDPSDTVLGRATLADIMGKNLNHRVVHIVMLNENNEIAVQKRLPNSRIAPGKWTSSATGIVLNNETYRQAATRIVKESLGVNPEIKFSGKLSYRDPRGHIKFIGVFAAQHSGPFRIDANETEEIRFIPREEIGRMIDSGEVHPEMAFIIKS